MISIGVAIALTIGCYFVDNIPFAINAKSTSLFFLENYICKCFNNQIDCSDVLFINTSYDQTTSDYYDDHGFRRGKVAITDRVALDTLLSRLQKSNVYKQIFIDVKFEKNINTAADSSLFHRISEMRDVTISRGRDYELANNDLLLSKAGICNYSYTNENSGFSRYQFLQKGDESASLMIYKNVTNMTIRKIGFLPIFFDGSHLCKNSLFIKISKDMSVRSDGKSELNYYDLGKDINGESVHVLSNLTNDKFVFIGNFVDDRHSTYYGEQPGTYITYLATKALLDKRHHINYFAGIIMFIIYFIMGLWVMSDYPIMSYLNINKKIIRFVLSLICYTTVLGLISTIVYVFTKSTYNIFFPSISFLFLSMVIEYQHYK